MNRLTGQPIADESDHIRQSISDILSTPVGSRVLCRPYGSIVPDLIDYPMNAAYRLRLAGASVMAIARWEHRVIIKSALIDIDQDGRIGLTIEANRRGGERSGYGINISVPIK